MDAFHPGVDRYSANHGRLTGFISALSIQGYGPCRAHRLLEIDAWASIRHPSRPPRRRETDVDSDQSQRYAEAGFVYREPGRAARLCQSGASTITQNNHC